MKRTIEAGKTFHGPDGQGYRMKSDLKNGDYLFASRFEAFGGAPEPEPGKPLPDWLWREMIRYNEAAV